MARLTSRPRNFARLVLPAWTIAVLVFLYLPIVLLVVYSFNNSDQNLDLSSAWRHPGTRLGLWTHFTTQFSGTVFALMWGFPFLIAGEGLPRATASSLLTLFVLPTLYAWFERGDAVPVATTEA